MLGSKVILLRFLVFSTALIISWFFITQHIVNLQTQAMNKNLLLFDSMLKAESQGRIRVLSSTMRRNGSEYGSSDYIWIRIDAFANVSSSQDLEIVKKVVKKFNDGQTYRALLQTECDVLEIDHGQLMTIAPGDSPPDGQVRILLKSLVAPMTLPEMFMEGPNWFAAGGRLVWVTRRVNTL
jgi:hypothetical protein